MEIFWLVTVFIFGAIIGSFLNVVICRLHTGRSLNNRSHCLSCNKTLHWYDLIPAFSYLILRGRCRTCGAWIPIRYFFVEMLTGLSFVAIWIVTQDPVLIILNWILISIFIVGAVYDLYHFIIPDEIVASAIAIASGVLLYIGYLNADVIFILWSLGAGIIAFLCYAGLWYVSSGRWIGFGDAKLAVPLGMLVGLGGVFSLVVLSFWVGAAVSLTIIAGQAVWAARKRLYAFTWSNAGPNISNGQEKQSESSLSVSSSAVGARNTYTSSSIEKSSKYLSTTNEKQGGRSRTACSSDVVAKNRRYFTTANEGQSEGSPSVFLSADVARNTYTSNRVEKSSKYLTIKSEIPFAPFLIIAFVLVYLFHADVLSITLFALM